MTFLLLCCSEQTNRCHLMLLLKISQLWYSAPPLTLPRVAVFRTVGFSWCVQRKIQSFYRNMYFWFFPHSFQYFFIVCVLYSLYLGFIAFWNKMAWKWDWTQKEYQLLRNRCCELLGLLCQIYWWWSRPMIACEMLREL